MRAGVIPSRSFMEFGARSAWRRGAFRYRASITKRNRPTLEKLWAAIGASSVAGFHEVAVQESGHTGSHEREPLNPNTPGLIRHDAVCHREDDRGQNQARAEVHARGTPRPEQRRIEHAQHQPAIHQFLAKPGHGRLKQDVFRAPWLVGCVPGKEDRAATRNTTTGSYRTSHPFLSRNERPHSRRSC